MSTYSGTPDTVELKHYTARELLAGFIGFVSFIARFLAFGAVLLGVGFVAFVSIVPVFTAAAVGAVVLAIAHSVRRKLRSRG